MPDTTNRCTHTYGTSGVLCCQDADHLGDHLYRCDGPKLGCLTCDDRGQDPIEGDCGTCGMSNWRAPLNGFCGTCGIEFNRGEGSPCLTCRMTNWKPRKGQ